MLVRTSKIYLLFTASGATALIYQVIWSRWLGLVFGNTTASVSIVLGSFMSGLALGSWLAGRFLHRISNPMRAYAILELCIGAFALCFPALSQLTDFVFTHIVSTESTPAFSIAARAILSFSLLLLPTTLMGATLPVLTDFFRRNPSQTRSWKVGLLYAANTMGAAIGIFSASFFLIELIGVWATTLGAALLNFIIAFLGLRLTPSPLAHSRIEPVPPNGGKLSSMEKLVVIVLVASGATALASEVLWTRTLETLVGNSTYAFSMIILLYLLGIAAGSWLMSMFVNQLNRLPFWIASMQLGMGIWMILSVTLLEEIIRNISQYSQLLLPMQTMLWNYFKVMVLLLPLSLLSGACFPLATRILNPMEEEARGGVVARACMWNTAGAFIGSIMAGFLIAPFLDYVESLYALALLYSLTAFMAYVVIYKSEEPRSRERLSTMSASALSVLLMAITSSKMVGSNLMTRFNDLNPLQHIVYHVPGLQGVTTVIKNRNAHLANRLLVNGMGMTIKVTDTKMMAHIPLLLHPAPQDTLVICFGMGTTYRSAISYGGNVTVVELVKEVMDAFEFFYQDAAKVRAYPKGRMVVNDGRSFLKLTPERYDVITVDPPPPIDGAGVNHLYSKEFLELARSRLKKGGIMAHWIPYPGSLAGVDDQETFDMLLMTFADVFPYMQVQRGFRNIGLHVLGSMEPLEISPDLVMQRLSNQDVLKDLNELDVVPLDYFKRIQEFRAPRNKDWLITDDRPRLEFYLLRTWQYGGKKTFVNNIW